MGSQFFNDLAGLMGDQFMKMGATLPFCDWKTRDAFANMDIAGYNYGIYRYSHDLRKYPDRLILGSACPYYELSYLGDVTDTYFGEALAVVRAGDGEQLVLTVSDGTHSARAYVAIEQEN